ncbi:DNA-processing protein DprA [Tellurirhabdus rosea]|uniref:DNA-processing protein DprA n=1 Tax=Tellurirhabdus rosea TaxID=2674997 RepID=UPI00224DD671|nr:DNA-processing protein DprA [Tellurirhabdus rosea]
MNELDEIYDILFYTYLTGYNIADIYYLLSKGDLTKEADFLDERVTSLKGYLSNRSSFNKLYNKAKNDAEFAIQYCRYLEIKMLPYTSSQYPKSLYDIKDKPPLLFIKGKLNRRPLVAVVGTRDISQHAERITSKIVRSLTHNGVGVVSGLALGIDAIAHKNSIDQYGYTIAVMPNSLDTIYPKDNIKLANEILDGGGALISELAFNINRGKKSFVERNRIQAALSEIVIPIEMTIKSGTMHTVNFAKYQNKKIILLKPSKVLTKLPQYEGIEYLINLNENNRRDNVMIAQNMEQFIEIIEGHFKPDDRSLDTGIQLTLFDL